MKKMFMILFACMVLLGTAAYNCQAGPVEFWAERWDDATLEFKGDPDKIDLTMTFWGMEHQWERFKLGFQYGFGDLDNVDVDFWEIKAGYRLVDKEKIKLDFYLSWFDIYVFMEELEGLKSHLDFNWYPTERSVVTASLGYGLDSEIKLVDVGFDLYIYKLKYTYYLTDQAGLMIGYRGLLFDFDEYLDKLEGEGFIAGVSFRF